MEVSCPFCGSILEIEVALTPGDEVRAATYHDALAAHILEHRSDPSFVARFGAPPLTAQVIDETPDEDLPMLVWNSLPGWETWSLPENAFWNAERLNMEVLNGGLVQFFDNVGEGDVDDTREALRLIGAYRHAEILDEAVAIWLRERAAPDSCWDGGRNDRGYSESSILTLEGRFSEVPLEPIESAFVRAHADAFVHDD